MQKHKLHLQMLDYTVLNIIMVCFKPICTCGKTPYIAFQEPDELLVSVYAGCKIVSEKAHYSLFQSDNSRLKSTKNTLLRSRFYA